METINLIKNSLDYMDKKMSKYYIDHIRIASYNLLINKEDLKLPKIICYDKNKKKVFKANIQIMGNYYKKSNMWIWGWAIQDWPDNEVPPKNITYLSREILKYGLDISTDFTGDKNQDSLKLYLKFLLTNSRTLVKNQIEMDVITAICLYLSKKDFILKLRWDKVTPKVDYISYCYIYNIQYED